MFVAGIDIGATNTEVGIVNTRGDITACTTFPTLAPATFEDYVKRLADVIRECMSQTTTGGKLVGIGVGAPMGNYYTGEIENAVNLPWGRVNLAKALEAEFPGVRVGVTNDANAAAIGEMSYGVAKGMKNFIMLTLGSGIGSGIVVNGHLVLGCDGFAGELGHRPIKKNNARQCSCGQIGCLETYCSARGMAKTAREMIELTDEPSLLRDLPLDDITSKDVYLAAKKGDKLALKIFEYTGKILGEAISDMIVFTSPEAVVLFGGLANSGELLLEPTRRSLEKNVMAVFKGHTKLLQSALNESEAAVLGASAIGWEVSQKLSSSE